MLKYLSARLRERSTWVGLSMVFSASTYAAAPEAYKPAMFWLMVAAGAGAAVFASPAPGRDDRPDRSPDRDCGAR